MPELPEVETVRKQLEQMIVGKKISDVLVLADKTVRLAKSKFIKMVVGTKVVKVDRRAKLLILNLSNSLSILAHLKMTGQFIYNGEVHKHTRVVFGFGKNQQVVFNDLRRFGYLDLIKSVDVPALLEKKYGPEPLDKEFTVDKFAEIMVSRPKAKIKQLLLEQNLVAGIGNIYAQEACYIAGISPTRSAGKISKEELKKLHRAIIDILKKAVAHGGTTADDYLNVFGKKGDYAKFLKVYGRAGESCLKCKSKLKMIKIGGRGTVYCEVCQK